MNSRPRTGLELVWGAVGPLSILFGGTITLQLATQQQTPSYRVFDRHDIRIKPRRHAMRPIRRVTYRRRSMSY